jgi:hypothetical protein
MPELSFRDIDQISNDIRKQEITFSHLADELIDHLCCDVEYQMKNGMSFPEAYRFVKEKMGSRRLKEIQEETLYVVDTKYRQMKNTMKISAIAGTIMLGFAALFKVMHWPGAGILLTLGAFTLAFVFMPSALTVLWKESHSSKRLFLYHGNAVHYRSGVQGSALAPGSPDTYGCITLRDLCVYPGIACQQAKGPGKQVQKDSIYPGCGRTDLLYAGAPVQNTALARGKPVYDVWNGNNLFCGLSMVHIDHVEGRQKCQRKIHRDGCRLPGSYPPWSTYQSQPPEKLRCRLLHPTEGTTGLV